MVVLNASAAFVTAGLNENFSQGTERAIDSIGSGRAMEKLNSLINCLALNHQLCWWSMILPVDANRLSGAKSKALPLHSHNPDSDRPGYKVDDLF